MFLRRLLPKRPQPTDPDGQLGCAIFIILVVAAGALVAKLAMLWWPHPSIPLLTPAVGRVDVSNVQEATQHTSEEIYAPTELLGAEIAAIGVYTTDAEDIPHDSVTIVLTRNGWRMIEIVEQSLDAWDRLKAHYGNGAQTVMIGNAEALLVDLHPVYTRCLPGNNDQPGTCQITTLLVVPIGNRVVSLAVDGTHATPGELITIARSLTLVPTYEAR